MNPLSTLVHAVHGSYVLGAGDSMHRVRAGRVIGPPGLLTWPFEPSSESWLVRASLDRDVAGACVPVSLTFPSGQTANIEVNCHDLRPIPGREVVLVNAVAPRKNADDALRLEVERSTRESVAALLPSPSGWGTSRAAIADRVRRALFERMGLHARVHLTSEPRGVQVHGVFTWAMLFGGLDHPSPFDVLFRTDDSAEVLPDLAAGADDRMIAAVQQALTDLAERLPLLAYRRQLLHDVPGAVGNAIRAAVTPFGRVLVDFQVQPSASIVTVSSIPIRQTIAMTVDGRSLDFELTMRLDQVDLQAARAFKLTSPHPIEAAIRQEIENILARTLAGASLDALFGPQLRASAVADLETWTANNTGYTAGNPTLVLLTPPPVACPEVLVTLDADIAHPDGPPVPFQVRGVLGLVDSTAWLARGATDIANLARTAIELRLNAAMHVMTDEERPEAMAALGTTLAGALAVACRPHGYQLTGRLLVTIPVPQTDREFAVCIELPCVLADGGAVHARLSAVLVPSDPWSYHTALPLRAPGWLEGTLTETATRVLSSTERNELDAEVIGKALAHAVAPFGYQMSTFDVAGLELDGIVALQRCGASRITIDLPERLHRSAHSFVASYRINGAANRPEAVFPVVRPEEIATFVSAEIGRALDLPEDDLLLRSDADALLSVAKRVRDTCAEMLGLDVCVFDLSRAPTAAERLRWLRRSAPEHEWVAHLDVRRALAEQYASGVKSADQARLSALLDLQTTARASVPPRLGNLDAQIGGEPEEETWVITPPGGSFPDAENVRRWVVVTLRAAIPRERFPRVETSVREALRDTLKGTTGFEYHLHFLRSADEKPPLAPRLHDAVVEALTAMNFSHFTIDITGPDPGPEARLRSLIDRGATYVPIPLHEESQGHLEFKVSGASPAHYQRFLAELADADTLLRTVKSRMEQVDLEAGAPVAVEADFSRHLEAALGLLVSVTLHLHENLKEEEQNLVERIARMEGNANEELRLAAAKDRLAHIRTRMSRPPSSAGQADG